MTFFVVYDKVEKDKRNRFPKGVPERCFTIKQINKNIKKLHVYPFEKHTKRGIKIFQGYH